MYDSVLEIELPSGVKLIGFADDLAVVVWDRDINRLKGKANFTMRKIVEWMHSRRLELAPEKTEAVLLKGARRGGEDCSVVIGETSIPTSTAVKYLGVYLDGAMSFGVHIKAAAEKANKVVNIVARLMPNIGGPREGSRRILGAVINSILLYGAPAWAGCMRAASYRKVLARVQRKVALKTSRAYHTVSYEAIMVIASAIPIHLQAWEREAIYLSRPEGERETKRRETRAVVLQKWQQEWSEGTKGAWTRTLIPDIAPWFNRKHGELDFHVTQMLSGHGCYGSYTYKIKKTVNDRCFYCQESDTPAHTLFYCGRWEENRRELNRAVGRTITEQNLVPTMLVGESEWKLIAMHVKNIMSTKERDELQRQRETPITNGQ